MTAHATAPAVRADDFAVMRQAMVASQLRTAAVDDPRVVAAIAQVPREAFVPGASADLAYRDTAIDLGQGRRLNTPLATARLIVAARLLPADRVLLVGAATGYAAAILAKLVAQVTAVESTPALVAQARTVLADTPNVTLVEGPLEHGHPDGAPYDVLFIDGAVEDVPTALVQQLADGARVVTGLIDRGVTRLCAGRVIGGALGLNSLTDIEMVALPGFCAAKAFTF